MPTHTELQNQELGTVVVCVAGEVAERYGTSSACTNPDSVSSTAEKGRGSLLARRSIFQRNRVINVDEFSLG